jgi:hypothetical protein
MRFRDIPSFTRSANYSVDVQWRHLDSQLAGFAEDAKVFEATFELDPDFQRGHVWDQEKQIRFVEFVLRGGAGSRDIHFNCPGWQAQTPKGSRFVLVDGKQRIEAVCAFMRGDFPVFGSKYSEFTDMLPIYARFKFHVNNLPDDAAVLQWYLDLNDGGVVHSSDELARVRTMLSAIQTATLIH